MDMLGGLEETSCLESTRKVSMSSEVPKESESYQKDISGLRTLGTLDILTIGSPMKKEKMTVGHEANPILLMVMIS